MIESTDICEGVCQQHQLLPLVTTRGLYEPKARRGSNDEACLPRVEATEYDKPILAGVSLRHVSSSRGKIEKRQLQPTYGSKMSESRPVSSINAIAPTDNGNSNWQENKNKAYSYCKSTSSSYRPLIIMCVLTCTKYDCAQCQRAISGTEQLKECPESSQGIKCETTNECITENVSADQYEVCEMRRIEAEVAAAAEEEEAKRRQMRLKP